MFGGRNRLSVQLYKSLRMFSSP